MNFLNLINATRTCQSRALAQMMQSQSKGVYRLQLANQLRFYSQSTGSKIVSFKDKYGQEKDSLFDHVLALKPEDAQKMCLKYELPVVDKQIRNIQQLVMYFNAEDKKLRLIASEMQKKVIPKKTVSSEVTQKQNPPKSEDMQNTNSNTPFTEPRQKQETSQAQKANQAQTQLANNQELDDNQKQISDIIERLQKLQQGTMTGDTKSQVRPIQEKEVPMVLYSGPVVSEQLKNFVFEYGETALAQGEVKSFEKLSHDQKTWTNSQIDGLAKNMHRYTQEELNQITESILGASTTPYLNHRLLNQYMKVNTDYKDKLEKLVGGPRFQNPPTVEGVISSLKSVDLLSKNGFDHSGVAKEVDIDNLLLNVDLSMIQLADKIMLQKYCLKDLSEDMETSHDSANYRLLQSILSDQTKLEDGLLPSDLFSVVQACMSMNRNKELQNQLRITLHSTDYSKHSLDDFSQLYKCLADPFANKNGEQNFMNRGRVDQDITMGTMLEHLKQQIVRIKGPKDFKQILDIQETIRKFDPLINHSNEIPNREFCQNLVVEKSTILLMDLNDLVRQSILNQQVNVSTGSFLFPEMIHTKHQNFVDHVDPAVLRSFCQRIVYKSDQDKFVFHHLTNASQSNFHRYKNKPHLTLNFEVITRIMQDFKNSTKELCADQIQALSTLFSSEGLVKEYLITKEEMAYTSGFLLNNLEDHLSREDCQITDWPTVLKCVQLMHPIAEADKGANEAYQQLSTITKHISDNLDRQLLMEDATLANAPKFEAPLILDINKEMMKLFWHLKRKDSSYYQKSAFFKTADSIVKLVNEDSAVGYLFKHLETGSSLKENLRVTKPTQVYNQLGSILKHFAFKFEVANDEEKLKIKSSFLKFFQTIPNVRTLRSDELVTMFDLVRDMYEFHPNAQIAGQFDTQFLANCMQTMMLAASNLRTIEDFKYVERMNQFNEPMPNKIKSILNSTIEAQERRNARMILDSYLSIFEQSPEIFKEKKYTLLPLNYLMGQFIHDMPHRQVMTCLKVFVSNPIHNFDKLFLQNLFKRYSDKKEIESLKENGNAFLLEFANNWPFFLKNNLIIDELISLTKTSLIVEQTKALMILTNKNVYHPSLLKSYNQSFLKLADKQAVKDTLKDFLKISSYIGFTEGIDAFKLTKTMRRTFKTPDELEIEQLLDFCLILAISYANFDEMDAKSKAFIEKTLDTIESYFKGFNKVKCQTIDANGEKTEVILNTFPSFKSENKTFNKFMIHKFPTEKENKQNSNLRLKSSLFHDTNGENYQLKDQLGLMNKEIRKAKAKKAYEDNLDFQPQAQEDELITEANEEADIVEVPTMLDQSVDVHLDKLVADLNLPLEDEEPIIVDFDSNKDDEESEDDNLKIEEDPAVSGDEGQEQDQESELKAYDIRAREEKFNEEFGYQNSRKKNLAELAGKDLYNLTFTSIETLDFVNINRDNIVKAWTVLFHFRSCDFDTQVFEEFNSVVTRNVTSKIQGHDLFGQFLKTLISQSYEKGFRTQVSHKCTKTGWPIDITLNDSLGDETRKYGVFFFLQEEMSLNLETNTEQPLAVQSLMLKHLRNLSGLEVKYITENKFLNGRYGSDLDSKATQDDQKRLCNELLENLEN